MQKAQKLVIKQIISIAWVLFSINCIIAQQNNDDYDITYLVMQNTHNINDSVYIMVKHKTITDHYHLRRYFNFRVNNKPFYTKIVIDSTEDDVLIDSIQLKKDIIRCKKKYRILDSLFTKEEIRRISNLDKKPQNVKKEKWDSTHLIFNTY